MLEEQPAGTELDELNGPEEIYEEPEEQADNAEDSVQFRHFSLFVRLLPIVVALTYLTGTVLLFAFGPWPWPVQNEFELYTFLTCAHVALLLGYISAVSTQPRLYSGSFSAQWLVNVCLVVTLILLVPTSLSRTGSPIPSVSQGIENPGIAYSQTVQFMSSSELWFVEYTRILVGPFLFMMLPLSVFYWATLPWLVRIGVLFCTAWTLAIYIAMGVNKIIFDTILISAGMTAAGYFARYLRVRIHNKVLVAALLIAGVFFFFVFFTSGQLGRITSGATSGYIGTAKIFADQNNVLVRYLPHDLALGAIALTSYITQGYWGLALSMQQPFQPTFGAGHSIFLLLNVAKIPGLDWFPNSAYPMQVERDLGFPFALYAWSSIYPWIASDVGFIGTIVVVFIIGRLLAFAWLDTLQGNNPFAVAMLAQFTIMIAYFSANNQCVQSGEGFTAFYFCLGMWLFTRRKASQPLEQMDLEGTGHMSEMEPSEL